MNYITDGENLLSRDQKAEEGFDLGWLPAFPHVLIASMSNFLFGYHIGCLYFVKIRANVSLYTELLQHKIAKS